uniref:40S ribosomal protein S27 n=1 Tax=Scophthalmus maximus TaxID=52904 RepID=A0A8D3AZ39_SCOMX
MPLAKDLLHPTPEEEKRRHKKKRLVQSPNSYFMDVKCPGCYKITTVFSHAQTVVLCVGCSTVLCQPTGGKARLTEGQYCPCNNLLYYLHSASVRGKQIFLTWLKSSLFFWAFTWCFRPFLKRIVCECV